MRGLSSINVVTENDIGDDEQGLTTALNQSKYVDDDIALMGH